MRHTPGPWRRAPYLNGSRLSLVVWAAEGIEVASVRGWAGDSDEQPSANADLIAAAPALLSACRAALAQTAPSTPLAGVLSAAIALAAKGEP
jgi:hypothetical protein